MIKSLKARRIISNTIIYVILIAMSIVWLLPIAWVERWRRFLKRNQKQDNSLAKESLAISTRRTELLKKYDIL